MTEPNRDEPAGISFHDELQNVSASNRVEKQTTAPVVLGIPQGPGLTAAKAKAQAEADTDQGDEPFDPKDHTVADVQAYLAGVDDTERDRVLALERDGKARASLAG